MESLKALDPPRIASYELLGRLGAGGMGLVYLARSRGRRLVAVKVIQTDLTDNPQNLERFRLEVEAAKEVSGHYTAPVIDADLEGRPAWLATSYIDGPNLDRVITRQGPLDRRAVTALAAALAEALKAIHAAKLVHRDLKPANILLAADGPRVIDFGIVRAVDRAELTRHRIGTPEYMSPEQAECVSVGPESDVFSLGGVLYFAATGHHPFGTGDTAAVLRRVVEAEPDLARVPQEHRELIGRCLARQPSERPTPDEILDDFFNDADAALDNQAGTDWTSGSIAPLIKEHIAQTALYTRQTDPQGRYRPTPEPPFELEPDPLAEDLSAPQSDAHHPRRSPQWPTRGSLWSVLNRRRGGHLWVVGLGVALVGTVVAVLGTAALREGGDTFRPWSVDDVSGGAVVVSNGLVYVGREKGLAAYDSRTGEERWKSESRESETLVGRYGALLLARSDKGLAALDPRSGKRRWRIPLESGECITAQSDSVAVVDPLANGEHLLSIFDTATGT
ncbi:protein kinase domain-containing protein, partial [Actinomadura welshii]